MNDQSEAAPLPQPLRREEGSQPLRREEGSQPLRREEEPQPLRREEGSQPLRREERFLKRLYHWTMALADKPYAPYALGLIAFAESAFFPVPPDVILIPMSLARPKRAWLYALICTAGSVAGALLGYAIGALLYDTVGKWLIALYGYGPRMEAIKVMYAQWGWAVILFKGLTPIPFKIVTITSGLLSYNLPLFVLLCTITRGTRFLIEALLMHRFGNAFKTLLERYFGTFMIVLVAIVVIGFYIAVRII